MKIRLNKKAIKKAFKKWLKEQPLKDYIIFEKEQKAVEADKFFNLTNYYKGIAFKMIYVKGNDTISDFYIGETVVTQELYEAIMDKNPSHFKGNSENPVEMVSWNDAQEFVEKLNKLTDKTYRLLTEAEWEYAAKGGNQSKSYKYSGSDDINEVAWYEENSNEKTHPVAQKSPNELGIYDMSGNVYEWCQNKISCVLRGGGWYSYAQSCRVACRNYNSPNYRNYSLGFRLAMS